MKRTQYLFFVMAAFVTISSCKNASIDYQKTNSGLLYKIYSSSSKGELGKPGNTIKLHFVQKLDDSLMVTTYGKAPAYIEIPPTIGQTYNPIEILTKMKKGDSAITVALTDTLFARHMLTNTPPFKAHQRIIISLHVLDIFTDAQAAAQDRRREDSLDAPRAQKEMMAEREKQTKEMEKQLALMRDEKLKVEADYVQSGKAAVQIKEMEKMLAAKNITAVKTPKGAFVKVIDPGTGPAVEKGKYVMVKYKGMMLPSDSVFQESQYEVRVGDYGVISGWEEGLPMLKQGGKAKFFIPGYLAYGDHPPVGSPFKPQQPMSFDIEVLSVSDTPTAPQQ